MNAEGQAWPTAMRPGISLDRNMASRSPAKTGSTNTSTPQSSITSGLLMGIFQTALLRTALLLGAFACSTPAVAQDLVAHGYFVDSVGGNDANDGTTHATRWKTLAKVSSTVRANGADVWLLEGSSFQGETLVVDWGGSANDPVIVGTYHLVSGSPTVGYASSRAEIHGTYNSACSVTLGARAGSLCSWSQATESAAVPTSFYKALVTVSANYVTLQDLFVTESAGIGILINNGADHSTTDNVKISATAAFAYWSDAGSQYSTLRNSDISYAGLSSKNADSRYGNRPHAVLFLDTRPSYALLENTYIHESFSEGAQCRKSSFCVFRGNRFSNLVNLSVYLDNASDVIVENNEFYGETLPSPPGVLGSGWGQNTGISVAVEPSSNPNYNSVRNIVRNNLFANVSSCLNINVFPTLEAAGWQTGGKFVGNTCLAFSTNAININDPEANIAGWEIANNIFDRPNNRGASVCTQTVATPRVTFHHNAWSATPSAAECRGSGDVVGPSGVSTSFDWTKAGSGHFPDAADWELSAADSVAAKAGDPMTDSMATEPDGFLQFPNFTSRAVGGSTCLPTLSEWRREFAIDFLCRPRDASSPNIGALERGEPQKGNALTLFVD